MSMRGQAASYDNLSLELVIVTLQALLAADSRQQTSATHLGTLDTQVSDEEYAEMSDLYTTTEQFETHNQSSNNQRGEVEVLGF